VGWSSFGRPVTVKLVVEIKDELAGGKKIEKGSVRTLNKS